jgi:hypothetical protein
MLTLSWKRKRRVPPQRGRGAISGLFFCFAQCSILAVGASRNQVDPFGFSPSWLLVMPRRARLEAYCSSVTALTLACTDGKPRLTKARAFRVERCLCLLPGNRHERVRSGAGWATAPSIITGRGLYSALSSTTMPRSGTAWHRSSNSLLTSATA